MNNKKKNKMLDKLNSKILNINKKIDISVIVPIYGVQENMLKTNIEHLISQSKKEIEILLVDDGSPDNCGKICDEYAVRDDRIRVIHQANKGLSGARNTGQKEAIGEYITFVDGDDFLELDALKIMYEMTKIRKYDVINACVLKDYGNKIIKMDYSKFNYDKEYLNEECKYWQEKVFDFTANISAVYAKIYNRRFLMNNNLFHKENLKQGAEGLEFLIRVFDKAQTIKHINKYLYHYMYNEESITERHNEKNHELVIKCFEEMKADIVLQKNYKKILSCMYERLNYVIITTAISGYFSPSNVEPYHIAKKKYKEYLKKDLIQETLKHSNKKNLDLKRKITLFLIINHMFFCVKLIAIIRYKQKQSRKRYN